MSSPSTSEETEAQRRPSSWDSRTREQGLGPRSVGCRSHTLPCSVGARLSAALQSRWLGARRLRGRRGDRSPLSGPAPVALKGTRQSDGAGHRMSERCHSAVGRSHGAVGGSTLQLPEAQGSTEAGPPTAFVWQMHPALSVHRLKEAVLWRNLNKYSAWPEKDTLGTSSGMCLPLTSN